MEKIEAELRDAVPDTKGGRRVFGLEMGAILVAIVLMAMLAVVIFLIEAF